MTYFLAPYINSYKRFQAGSFAPTNLVWSRDNRTSGFRVLGHGPATRVECRVGGADVNPYLAFAAFLAAGLHGIEQRLELQPAFQGDAYKSGEVPAVPATLRDAVDRLDRSDGAAPGDGRRGDRPLCPCRPLGARRVRQGGHRLGAAALLRAGLAAGDRAAVTLPWTLALLVVGLALAALARWHETRPRELGEVRLFPATLRARDRRDRGGPRRGPSRQPADAASRWSGATAHERFGSPTGLRHDGNSQSACLTKCHHLIRASSALIG